ncbi:MAG: 50S ribosomal protein L2 [Candidatus Abawacabacteria bacterium RIFCSPHIGHO2_01_FULL_46_8]|uniref:Large ribosomal subunit protein uL2 n=1 Tax=Candidatus Abawacabacteria bacterium RIFCSPHIGHO2_01_FULL_46_8 TaxID=1817815 RepID=A0A1F4XPE1_9BACT|nr:ribosomal protein L2 [uncultured bacterium]OGC82933.1 MAG: 50S ribosomal protein L2 [Candidatus Abawacabacteria bacterium RIFCSPHIGHO2_01_FULL_46_8]
MTLKTYKPTTPSRRLMSVADFSELTKVKPLKKLTIAKKSQAGRGNTGKITVRHRGGGHARRLRIIDFKQDKWGISGKVATLEYDPNRSARIALIHYTDGEKRYILAPNKLQVGFLILSAEKAPIQLGNRLKLIYIPEGTAIYNIELTPGKGGQIARAAGTSGRLVSLEGKYAQIKMPSGKIHLVSKDCFATIGEIGNAEHNNIKIGKAGRSRWLGRRPQVLGKSMNPVDHPHGGGEGHNPIGLKHPKTPWGKPALGYKTRRNKRTQKWLVLKKK